MRQLLVIGAMLLLPVACSSEEGPSPEQEREDVSPGLCDPTGRLRVIEGVEFVEIGPGSFRMGSESRAGEPGSDEDPVHRVRFENGFWIGSYEITNEQYERFDPEHERSEDSPGDRHPVVDVSWEDARAYCDWLSSRSGSVIGLPSEAMWEAACRAGSSTEYCFGDDEDRLAEFAWYGENSGGQAHEVGSRRPNAWGLYDLHGNVWEWCEDMHHIGYENAPNDGSAWTKGGTDVGGGPLRVRRGGSLVDPAQDCRSARRCGNHPEYENQLVGFRLCLWPEK